MAHVTLDLSKYDALTAYKGLPDEKEENPARFFPDTSSVRRCVRERMSVMGLDAAELAGRAGVPLSSAEELVETGLTLHPLRVQDVRPAAHPHRNAAVRLRGETAVRELHAWENGHHVGVFSEDDEGAHIVRVRRDEGLPISLSLPRTGGWRRPGTA